MTFRLTTEALAERVLAAPRSGRRRLVALAGPPASGKSTLADALAAQLCSVDCATQIVPMDGFHLHNQLLIERGLLNRKGAPETFDARGFLHLVSRLHDEPDVIFPSFDRSRDIAIAGAGLVASTCDTVIVEGNYLLFDAPIWRDLRPLWDLAIRLDVPDAVISQRLVARWLTFGLSPEQAEARAAENDLANARLIANSQLNSDITI